MGEAAGHRFGQIIGEEIFEKAIYTLLKGFAEKHQLYLDKEETRRAALLEAAQVAITYGGRARDEDLSGSYTSELIVQALDRLAQEGASSIDLSPTIKDDGGYGEHF